MQGVGFRVRSATVALLLGVVLVAAPAAAQADDCYRVSATATTVLDPATGVFSGEATFELDGVPQQVPAQAFVTGPTTSSHVFTFSQGMVVVTKDRLVLVPIDEDAGLYSLQSKLVVVEGGRGWIQLLPESTIDLVGGAANWVGRGRLCLSG